MPGPGQQRFAANGRGEQGPRRTISNGSPWDTPARRPMTGPLAAAMTGPMLAVKGAAALVTPKEDEPLRNKVLRIFSVSVIVIAAVAAGVYLLTNSGGNSPSASLGAGPTTSIQPTTVAKTPASKATSKTKTTKKANTKTKTGATAATAGYVLSTPATAGGYPMGQDPHFLATATTTAQSVLHAVSNGGGGTVKGSAVSAAYKLPSADQVITFVGYKGTFNPAKVISSMGSFGTTDGTYSDAKTGDSIACLNTSASPSGAVCVWATKTTIGVTEFFDVAGPEVLTTSQDRGAADTVKLRSGVETKKS
jgi:hypothetical protein